MRFLHHTEKVSDAKSSVYTSAWAKNEKHDADGELFTNH